ncbi:MAG: neutral/alkaline non-lysosomal ceramidase N-terminal domain-containing protein [Gemmataceae bacterium]|nr:neutral/alkaline non-lysosomal ceramidase N-terminal domain-containing protein [Gemmataceae bacterium]
MWMSGYSSRKAPAEGKLQDLYAKALVLEDAKGKRAVLVTMDLIGIGRDLAVPLCRNIEKELGIGRADITLSTSHTHCGPVVGDNLAPLYFLDEMQTRLVRDYADELTKKIVDVVGKATRNLAPAKLAWGMGTAGFAVNRRNNKEPDVPMLREAGLLQGPVDHDVPVLSVRDANDKLKAIVFGYACHATTLSFQQWCGDYPGFAQEELEKEHPGTVALFWAGCGADQNPLPRRTVALAEKYGHELATAVQKVIREGKNLRPVPPRLATGYSEIELAFDNLPSREHLEAELRAKDKYKAARAALLLARLEKTGKLRQSYPYPVQVWQLGEVTWVALGGEVVVDFSLRLKKEIAPDQTWVMGYANDVMAYIPSLRVLREGGYEGATAMVYYGQPTVWSPRVEESIVRAVHAEVKKVR